MGMHSYAHLAYGYVLAKGDEFKIAELDENGEPNLSWIPVDDYGYRDSSNFADLAMSRLLASVGFVEGCAPANQERLKRGIDAEETLGVEVSTGGHFDLPMWLLTARGSETGAPLSEVLEVDAGGLSARPGIEGWDKRLSDALAILGITPTQVGAKWLIFPSYG